MCGACEARANDPRYNAFPDAGILTIIPVAEQEKPDDSPLPAMATLVAYTDSGVAKFQSFTLMRDDDIAVVRHHDHPYCLN